jgi:hypothetical protein
VKQPSKKHLSHQRAFLKTPIESVVVKSVSFGSINHPFFREMIQRANPDFSESVHNTLRHNINQPGGSILAFTRASREKLLLFDGRQGEEIRPTLSGSHHLMGGYVRFVGLKVLNDEQAPTISENLVMIPSTLAAQKYIVAVVCTDKASGEVSIPDELQTFLLPPQAGPLIIRIPCIAHTENLALGDFGTESGGAKRCHVRRIFTVLSDYTGAPFSDVLRL